MQRMHLCRALGHRVGDHVGLRGHRCGEVGHALGLQRIDAHGGQPAGRTAGLHVAHEQAARLLASRRRGEVLQVDDQRVGAAGEHGVVRARVGTGAEQPTAAQVGVDHGGFTKSGRVDSAVVDSDLQF